MVEVKLVTIPLWGDLAHEPFAGIDTETSALDSVVVDELTPILGFENVAFLAVRNFEDFVCQRFHAGFACAGVLVREGVKPIQPLEDGGLGWHSFVITDRPEAFTGRNPFADDIGQLLRER